MKALLLTVAMLATAAVLSACGSSNGGLIPTGDAGQLQTALNNVSTYVILHDCPDTSTALAQLQSTFNGLPQSVDASLRANLGEGLDALGSVARRECRQASGSSGQIGPTEATGSTGTTSATGSTGTTTSTSSTSSTTSSATSTTTTTTTSSTSSTSSATSSAATSTAESGASGPTDVPTTGAGGGTQAGGSTSATGVTAPSGIGGSGGVASGN